MVDKEPWLEDPTMHGRLCIHQAMKKKPIKIHCVAAHKAALNF
jgi:hypothetical protein